MADRHAESAPKETFGGLLHQFHPHIKKMARQLERIEQKLVQQELSVEFNKTCLKEKNAAKIYLW